MGFCWVKCLKKLPALVNILELFQEWTLKVNGDETLS